MASVDLAAANLPPAETPTPPVEPPASSQYDYTDLEAAATPPEPTPEPTPEPAPVPEPPRPAAEVSKPRHSRTVVRRALELGAQYGVTQAQIESATPEWLDDWIEKEEILARQPAKVQEPPADLDDVDRLDEAYKANGGAPIDKEFKAFLKAQNAKIKKSESLEAEIAQLKEREHARERTTVDDAVDTAFAALPDDFSKRLGVGRLGEVNEAERKRRLAVVVAAGIDFKKLPSAKVLAKKLKDGYEEIYGVEAPAPEPEKPAKPAVKQEKNGKRISPEQWDNAGLNVPTNRKTAEPKGERSAIAAVARIQRENGWDEPDAEELNSVPD